MFVFLFSFNLGSIAKSLYLKAKGYSLFPMYLYPLYVYRNKKGKIKLRIVFEWTTLFRNLFPHDLVLQYDNTPKEVEKICTVAIRICFYTKIFVLAGIGLINYNLYPDVFIMVFYVLVALVFYWIANINTNYFHGEFSKIQRISKGDLILYLAKELCIYEIAYPEKKRIYNRFKNWLLKCEYHSDTTNLIASALKHMCIEEYAFESKPSSQKVWQKMKEIILADKTIQFGMFDETWELTKVYLSYSLLNGNTDDVTYVTEKMQRIRVKTGAYLSKMNDMMNWYIRIAHCELKENEKYNHPLFSRKDRFCTIAPTYKVQSEEMEARLLSMVID